MAAVRAASAASTQGSDGWPVLGSQVPAAAAAAVAAVAAATAAEAEDAAAAELPGRATAARSAAVTTVSMTYTGGGQ